MRGTIARMRVRPDVPEEYLRAQIDALDMKRANGFLWTVIYRSDNDPLDLWVVSMFDTKESYRANAESPAQHASYLTLRACLERDPEWNDVDEVTTLKP